jgi:uncharacterized protein (DUF433 family)
MMDFILERLGPGEPAEAILAAYPQWNKLHIIAALQYAASLTRDEIILAP